LALVMTTVARRLPVSLRRRSNWPTSPATAPDVNHADVQLAQLGGKPFLVPGAGVDDPQSPPERRAQRRIAGQERDPLIDLPRTQLARQLLHQPGTGDGRA